jgi:thioredoxin 1
MLLSLILSIAIGGGIGAGLGYFGQCSSGTCPLTSTWWRGALYGAALGLMFYFVSGRNGASVEESSKHMPIVKENEFEAQVTQSRLPVVVDFYAPWCGPCRRLAPVLDKVASQMSGRIRFVKINIDESSQLAQRFQIEGVPTLLFFKAGKLVDRSVGLLSPEELAARLQVLSTDNAG